MKIKKSLLITMFGLLSLVSCAHNQSTDSEQLKQQNFDLVISKQRAQLEPAQFNQWLKEQKGRFIAQKEGIEGALYSTGARGSYQEAAGSSSPNGMGTESFQVQMTNLELKRLQDRLNQVNKNLRTIDALLMSK